MKKCPYCAEEIQDEAIKCRYCLSDLSSAKVAKEDIKGLKVPPIEVSTITEPTPTRPSPQQSNVAKPNIKMSDEEFISSLESTIRENKLNIIPLNELHEIYNHAKLIVSCSNKMDIAFSKAINTLLEEIKKRGLPQGAKPQKIPNNEDSSFTKLRGGVFMAMSLNDFKKKYVKILLFVVFSIMAITLYNCWDKHKMIDLEKRKLQQQYERINYSTPFQYTPEQIRNVEEIYKRNINDLETDPDLYFYKKQEREKRRAIEVTIPAKE